MEQSSGTKNHLVSFILKMKQEGLPKIVIDTFIYYYEQILQGENGLICDGQIKSLDDDIEDWDNLTCYSDTGAAMMKQAVMIVLNGGLGTSMGLTGPKSLLRVKDGKTFLDIILKQAESAKVRLVLMNSFSTDGPTRAALQKVFSTIKPLIFLQHKFPKILQKDLSPAVCETNPDSEWNPPGHGDIYTALSTSGMLEKLLNNGIRYAFISNSDNLGSSIDETLLGYFAENEFPFMMEVAKRTPADIKGGHLARHEENRRLILREAAQCPGEETDTFRDIGRYCFFNTNNLWVNLEYLRELIQQQGVIRLPMILNPKTLNPRDETSPPVFQVETAMGAAISLFDGATAVKVSRSRFLPVKKCNELLLVRSDLFRFSVRNTLIPNSDRQSDDLPKIRLDSKYYGKTDLFEQRFPEGVPSLLECNALTVDGDVRFEQNIKLRGKVRIKNTKPYQAIIKTGSLLEGEVVF